MNLLTRGGVVVILEAMETKICKGGKFSCGQEKPLSEFDLRGDTGKYRGQCRECRAQYQKQYAEQNKNILLEYRIQYYNDHRDERLLYATQYREDHRIEIREKDKVFYKNNKDKRLSYGKQYKLNNRDTIRIQQRGYRKEKLQKNPIIKLHMIVSTKINQALKAAGGSKNRKSSKQFLPQSAEEVWEYLQILFTMPINLTPNGQVWMTKDNWKPYNAKSYDPLNPQTWTWNLDHIEPSSFLRYDNMECENFRKCWDKTNLRPLLAIQNRRDSNNRTPEQIQFIKEEIRQFIEQQKKITEK